MEHRCTQTEDKLNDKLNDEKIFYLESVNAT